MKKTKKQKESGRSMLEMIMVIAIIIILTIGALMGYRQVISRHDATNLYEDIMTRAESVRGSNFQGKSTYDSGMGNKTRSGLDMSVPQKENGTFTILVKDVPANACLPLKQKDWKDALRISIDDVAHRPTEVDCSDVNNDFDLKVIFPLRASAFEAFGRTCAECMSLCETCDRTTDTCINTCPTGYQCIENACTPVHVCAVGTEGDDCHECNKTYSQECSTCTDDSTPYWNGTTCVCHGNTCGTDAYCTASGNCEGCGTPDESCAISADEFDETTGCLTTEKITCLGSTPACFSDGKCHTCPPNASCSGGNGTFSCDSNYYRTGDSCTKCADPAEQSCKFTSNTYDANGCITSKKLTCSGSTPACFDDGQCHACPQNATCPNGTVQCNSGYGLSQVIVGTIEYQICCPEGTSSTNGTSCNVVCATDGTVCASCPSERPYYTGSGCSACPAHSSTTNTGNRLGNTSCYCEAGYFADGTQCSACPTGSDSVNVSTSGLCSGRCTNAYETQSGGNYTCHVCPTNSSTTGENNNQLTGTGCYCNTGYFADGNSCSICPTVDNPEISNNSTTCQTKCSNTLAIDNGDGTYTCTYCLTERQCGSQCCGNGQTCNTKTKVCECATDKPYYDETKNACVACRNFDDCGSDITKICNAEGVCETCENGQEANDAGNQCVCKNGNWTGSACECNEGYAKRWTYGGEQNSKKIENSCCPLLMKSYSSLGCSLYTSSFSYCTTNCARYGGNPPKGYFCSFEEAYPSSYDASCMPTRPLSPEYDSAVWQSQSITDYYSAAFYQRISEFHPQKKWVKGVGTIVTHDPLVIESERNFCTAIGGRTFGLADFPSDQYNTNCSWYPDPSSCNKKLTFAKNLNNAGVGRIYIYGNYGNNTWTNGVMKMDVYYLGYGNYPVLTSITTADRVYTVCFLGTDDSWLNCPKNASGNGNGNATNKKDCYCNDAHPKWNGTECVAQ